MFALEFQLLTGRYAAGSHTRRNRAEWPPHPARAFAAAVNAAGEHQNDPSMRGALRWLQTLGSPEIYASDASVSPPPTIFVPVNDTQAMIEAHPDHRLRRSRTFPVARPDDPRFCFRWPDVEVPEKVVAGLKELLDAIVRVGHSSSFVLAHMLPESVAADLEPTLVPAEVGTLNLRCWNSNQLELLDEAFAEHEGVKPRSLPYRPQGYARVGEVPPRTVRSDLGGDWIVLRRVGGVQVGASLAPLLATALRKELLKHAPPGTHTSLSGHAPDGSPAKNTPRLSFAPLPFVGNQYATGDVKGVAMLVPYDVPPHGKNVIYETIARFTKGEIALHIGDLGKMYLELEGSFSTLSTLRQDRWAATSRRWTTVTPIALDRHPHASLDSHTGYTRAVTSVIQSCAYIGLPPPVHVEISRHPLVEGATSTYDHPSYEVHGIQRCLVHATVEFAENIHGPVLLGAGRFLGLGLLMPNPSWSIQ